ncbi:MAG: hypothetical protein DMF93_06960 [Acidobacteria bacterium]|nr:MAG: hypothetical protein DMF93_06960 [Acidobacteriota bacterium]
MQLTDTGESRVNGYLFVLERSLKTFLPLDVVRDAVREIESHVRERIAAADATPTERDAVERILAELGPPLRVAQAYSAERTIEEAVATGRIVPMMRAIWHLAVSTVAGFFAAIALMFGYFVGIASIAVAAIKPFFPENAGIQFVRGVPVGFAAQFPVSPTTDLRGGYWVIPLALAFGLGVLVVTHRGGRKYLAWWRERRVS